MGRKWGTVALRVEVVQHRLKVRARQRKMRGLSKRRVGYTARKQGQSEKILKLHKINKIINPNLYHL